MSPQKRKGRLGLLGGRPETSPAAEPSVQARVYVPGMDEIGRGGGDADGVERIEVIFSTPAPPRGLRRLAPPQMRMSLGLLSDGTVRDRQWSFAVAYEIPEHRRAIAGADAISLLWDENGWHVESICYDDD